MIKKTSALTMNTSISNSSIPIGTNISTSIGSEMQESYTDSDL